MINKIQKAFFIQCLVDDDNDLYELTIPQDALLDHPHMTTKTLCY